MANLPLYTTNTATDFPIAVSFIPQGLYTYAIVSGEVFLAGNRGLRALVVMASGRGGGRGGCTHDARVNQRYLNIALDELLDGINSVGYLGSRKAARSCNLHIRVVTLIGELILGP